MNSFESIGAFIYPLKSIKEVFLLVTLTTETNGFYEMEFITATFNSIFSTTYDLLTLKVAISKFCRLIKINDHISLIKNKLKTQHKLIENEIKNCLS